MPSPAEPPTTGARRRACARALAVTALVLVLDRITKHLVVTGIAVGDVHKFLPAVNLVHVRNSGVAFGFFSGGGALVLILTLLALGALVAFFILRPRRPLLWLPTGLVVGGAIGNLIDRLSSGSVTDFIKLPLWPAFNLADSAITIGVFALLYVLEGPRQAPVETSGNREGSSPPPGTPRAPEGSRSVEGSRAADGSRPSESPRSPARVVHPER
ncbi:MAG: signal peptidase [Solirubrobacteraceae bacterium]|nr:signal peptidase [Solirubrobacteraceae bacterium]